MSTLPTPFLSPEQYLALERKAQTKSEYYQGETFAMAGGSATHSQLAVALASLLRERRPKDRCRIYNSDMRVRISPTGLYTYPDVTAVCGPPVFHENDTLLNPGLIAEILSPSTADYDRGLKFDQYRSLDSLQQYLIVWQDRIQVHLHTRQPDGWLLTTWDKPDDTVRLTALPVEFTLAELYQDVLPFDDEALQTLR